MAGNRRKASRTANRATGPLEPGESRTAEMLTIAWVVSVTGVLIADLLVVGARFLAAGNPGVAALALFERLLLLSASAMALVSLVLFVLCWRKRRLKPPQGYVAFALLACMVPIVATIVRLLT